MLSNETQARHYGFTDEELDFIPSTFREPQGRLLLRAGPSTGLKAGINHGITYRMGQDAGTEDDS